MSRIDAHFDLGDFRSPRGVIYDTYTSTTLGSVRSNSFCSEVAWDVDHWDSDFEDSLLSPCLRENMLRPTQTNMECEAPCARHILVSLIS